MGTMQQGGNAPVAGDRIVVSLAWSAPAGVEADSSAYLLTAQGKVRSDDDMVFYNQPQGAGGAIRFAAASPGQGAFDIDLPRLPGDVARIVFCATIDKAQARRQTLALLNDARISVGRPGAAPDLSFSPPLAGATEAAMTFGELYQRNGQWKFRAVGQGFNGGLAPLARSFGIDVADDPPPVAAPPPAVAPRAAAPPAAPRPAPVPPAPAPAAAPPSRPVSLSKVSLDKPGQSVSLVKRGSSFGEITVNLNWSRGKKSFFGSKAIDLDLGCLFELADGRKSVIQALGRAFGSYTDAPYIALSGDDRTGDNAAGETMRINGAHWNDLRRVAIFALIYDGAPNWQQTDGVVTVTMPDQPPIEVRLTDGRDTMRLCGVVLLENVGGTLKASRLVEYFKDQRELDISLGWGLQWRAGSKD